MQEKVQKGSQEKNSIEHGSEVEKYTPAAPCRPCPRTLGRRAATPRLAPPRPPATGAKTTARTPAGRRVPAGTARRRGGMKPAAGRTTSNGADAMAGVVGWGRLA
jgi:hypothetical protein